MDDSEVLAARGRRGLRKHRKQRSQRGWSYADAWSADTHLCQVIGEMALQLRDNGIGYPAYLTEEEWNVILTRIGEPLVTYGKHKFDMDTLEQEAELHESARQALLLFAEHFASFWD